MTDRWAVNWDAPWEPPDPTTPPSWRPPGWPGATPAATDWAPLTLAELKGLAVPELTYVVDGFIATGSLTLFTGREKEGKSLALLDAAASVAAGEDWAGRPTTAGPVLYCPAEDSLRTVRDRLRRRIGAGFDTDDRPLLVQPLSGVPVRDGEVAARLDLNNPVLVASLRGLVERVRPVLVVLDCLRELHAARENESDDMTVTMRPLRQLAHEFNVAVIVVHHASKGAAGGSRGSTAIPAACDAVASWTTGRNGADPDDIEAGDGPGPAGPLRATLGVKGRDVPRTAIRLELGDDLRFRPVGADTGETARGRVLAALTDGQWRTAAEIASASDVPTRTVKNILPSLLAAAGGRVERTATGTKLDPFRYRLPPPGPSPDPSADPDASHRAVPLGGGTWDAADPDAGPDADLAAWWRR